METIEKTTKESLQILGLCYGCEVEITLKGDFANMNAGRKTYTQEIDSEVFADIENNYAESFRITSLRTLDEMTEEEKETEKSLCEILLDDTGDIFRWLNTAESIHFLDEQGFDTMGINNKTILIKD